MDREPTNITKSVADRLDTLYKKFEIFFNKSSQQLRENSPFSISNYFRTIQAELNEARLNLGLLRKKILKLEDDCKKLPHQPSDETQAEFSDFMNNFFLNLKTEFNVTEGPNDDSDLSVVKNNVTHLFK